MTDARNNQGSVPRESSHPPLGFNRAGDHFIPRPSFVRTGRRFGQKAGAASGGGKGFGSDRNAKRCAGAGVLGAIANGERGWQEFAELTRVGDCRKGGVNPPCVVIANEARDLLLVCSCSGRLPRRAF